MENFYFEIPLSKLYLDFEIKKFQCEKAKRPYVIHVYNCNAQLTVVV